MGYNIVTGSGNYWENMDTLAFIELLKKQYEIDSDYGIAKLLGISTQMMSKFRLKKAVMSDELAEVVARKLQIPVTYIAVCLAAERSKCPNVKKELQGLSRKLTPAKIKRLSKTAPELARFF